MKKTGFLCLLLMLFCVISAASAQMNVGDYIMFGHYEQDNDLTNGAEKIKWQVLAVESDRVLVISRYGLDAMPYNTTMTGVTWETSSLREWLNGEFYSSAFSSAEQEQIFESASDNPDNAEYGTAGGSSTADRIFLLSIDEAEQYLKSEKARRLPVTAYAKENGAVVNNDTGYSWWWLRTPGFNSSAAAYVGTSGNIITFGDYVNQTDAAVRPAFWLSNSETVELSSGVPADPAAMVVLGENAIAEGDYETALLYLGLAAEAGNVDAQFRLGSMYVQGEGVPMDPELGAHYMKLAADQGNINAQNNMGLIYENGFGMPQSYENAAKYYQLAADQGYASAQNNLGMMYANGVGVEQSYEQALYYYSLAAAQNNEYALSNLAGLYYFGHGVEQSYEKAFVFFLTSAEQGNAFAQYAAGWMYEHGEGVEQDMQSAVRYYQMAADQGFQDAIDRLNEFL